MHTYHFYWIIHPERASLTLPPINAKTSIGDIYYQVLNNQLYIELKSTEKQTDIYTLKNNLKDLIQEEISIISYIYWNGYDTEIIRITNLDEDIDMTFWIDIPYINERNIAKIATANQELDKIHAIIINNPDNSIYIRRCFSELNKAIRFPIDTWFHCFRAIESLRHFCGNKYHINEINYPNISKRNNHIELCEWEKLWELTWAKKEDMATWKKEYAFNARHWNHKEITGEQRIKIFKNTWDIVDSFLEYLKNEK